MQIGNMIATVVVGIIGVKAAQLAAASQESIHPEIHRPGTRAFGIAIATIASLAVIGSIRKMNIGE